MIESQYEDDPSLTGLILLLYGYETVLTKDEFIVNIVENDKIKWIFDP